MSRMNMTVLQRPFQSWAGSSFKQHTGNAVPIGLTHP